MTPTMALTPWDRDYIEHLIQREEKAEAEFQASYQASMSEFTQIRFMGEDRYYWDLHAWPKPRGAKGHHLVMITHCPECHTRLDLSLVPVWHAPAEYRHTPGCEFFRDEQRQWVDDYADLRRGDEVMRGLIATEQAFFRAVGVNPNRYLMRVKKDDGGMIRTPVEVPSP